MMPPRRRDPPAFWAEKEQRWLRDLAAGDPLGWEHNGRSLRDWFHATVREVDAPSLCAYCDGSLGAQSRPTIDHFLPRKQFPALALSFANLYPACDNCNSGHKRGKWSCLLLRPDVDLASPAEGLDWATFSRYFQYDPVSGRLASAPGADRRDRRRVLVTIAVLGLNVAQRCRERRLVWKQIAHATRLRDDSSSTDLAQFGPYRFVTLQYILSEGASSHPVEVLK